MRYLLRIAVAIVASLGIAVPAYASHASATKLDGTTSAAGAVSLDMAGKKVTTLKPGTYSLTVSDKARKFEFRLSGPGMSKTITSTTFVGSKTEKVKLENGTYTFESSSKPTKTNEKGTFTVS
jgi:hypothetical protein